MEVLVLKITLGRKQKCKIIKGKHMFLDDVYKVQFPNSPPLIYVPVLESEQDYEDQFILWSDNESYELKKFVEVNL